MTILSRFGVRPIGAVRNKARSQEDLEGFRGKESEILIDPRYAKGLNGLDSYSHLIVLFLLHHTKGEQLEMTVHPGNRTHLPRLGIFATRNTRHRPNRIGVTVVQLVRVRGNIIRVRGLDAFNESPVLDVKPYVTWDLPGGSDAEGKVEGKLLSFDFNGRITVPEWWSRF